MGASAATQDLPPHSFGPQVELSCLLWSHDLRHHCAGFGADFSYMGIRCSLASVALRNHDASLVLRTTTVTAGTNGCTGTGGGGLQDCCTSRLAVQPAGSAMQQKAAC